MQPPSAAANDGMIRDVAASTTPTTAGVGVSGSNTRLEQHQV